MRLCSNQGRESAADKKIKVPPIAYRQRPAWLPLKKGKQDHGSLFFA